MAKYTKNELQEGARLGAKMLRKYAKVCDVESRKAGIQRSEQIALNDEVNMAHHIAEQLEYLNQYVLSKKTTSTEKEKKDPK